MKRIAKQPNPLVTEKLNSYINIAKKSNQTPFYRDFPEKDRLRQSLLSEQGYICGFCMQRIKNDPLKTKIAHVFPQNPNSDQDKQKVREFNLDLDYSNMIAVCDGNQGKSPKEQHCDTSQGNRILVINPCQNNCESFIDYRSSGEIFSKNNQMNNDLQEILNLNIEKLIKARKSAYDAVRDRLFRKYSSDKPWTKRKLEQEIENYTRLRDGKYAPYCQYVIYFLQKKLAKL